MSEQRDGGPAWCGTAPSSRATFFTCADPTLEASRCIYHLFSPAEARTELSSAGFSIASMEPESFLPETAVVTNSLLGRLDDLACEAVPAASGYGFLIVARP